jgi:outer membrane protein insertion porin family
MGRRMSLVLLLFAGALGVDAVAQTGPPKRDFQIDSIAIEGNRILSVPAILGVSGLRSGAQGSSDAFDAARDRLLATGYFNTVSYRFKPATTAGVDVIFTVAEIDELYPIRVDALGVTTEEIAAYLKAHDPLFTGKLPGTKPVLDRVSREIEQYLEAHNHAANVGAKVEVRQVEASKPGQYEIDFRPARGLPAVSIVTFEGSKVIGPVELRSKIGEVAFGQPYTEDSFRVFLENQIGPLYAAKGYMHVTFPKIVGTPAKDVEGVDVEVTVDEGEQYKLSKVSAGGTAGGKTAVDSARILKAARLPQMTIANFDEIREGADRVRESMRHQGFLDALVTTDSKRDDAQKTVEFIIVVEQGPEYKFGKLTVLGLGLDGEAAIRRMWVVNTGDPFPAEYPNIFVKRVKEDGLFDNLADAKADTQIDRTSHIVNVTVDFKYGAATQPKDKLRRGPGR